MNPIDLTELFDITEDNTDGVRSVKLVFKPRQACFLLKADQTLDEVVSDPHYQLCAIDALLEPFKDAKSVILTGSRFGLKQEKRERMYALRDEIDALKAELASLKG